MNRRTFLAASALGPLSGPAWACPEGAEALTRRLKERPLPPLDLRAGPTPAALEAAAEALRISEAWFSVTPMSRASSRVRRAAERDAAAVGEALNAVAAWLDAMPSERLAGALERLRLDPELERAWRGALAQACPPALAARLDARVDEALSALLSGPPLPLVRGWTAGLRPRPRPTAQRAPPAQRVVVGAGLGVFGGLVLSRGGLMLLSGGPVLWPLLFTGLGALILALGVGVMVVAIRDLRAAG